MRIIGAVVAAVLLLWITGVRLTTDEAKDKAEANTAKIVELEEENDAQKTELYELKIRYDDLLRRFNDLIRYFEKSGISPKSSYGGLLEPNIIRIPGSDDNDDDNGNDETRIIERNNTTVSPPNKDNDDSDDSDDSPIVEIPDTPELPKIPDIEDTKNDLLKNTPLDGVL